MTKRTLNYTAPKHGDTRTIIRFLLFPRSINGKTKWLCIANIAQKYEGYNWANDGWHDTGWA